MDKEHIQEFEIKKIKRTESRKNDGLDQENWEVVAEGDDQKLIMKFESQADMDQFFNGPPRLGMVIMARETFPQKTLEVWAEGDKEKEKGPQTPKKKKKSQGTSKAQEKAIEGGGGIAG